MEKEIILPLIAILICVGITQTTAYFLGDRKTFTLNYLALFTIAVQWVAFLFAGGIIFGNERTEKYYDLMGSITFLSTLALSLYLSSHLTLRQIILSAFVAVWTVRLGTFLFTRIHKNNGIDSRFTEIKLNNYRFLMTWTLQGVWVFLTMLPVLMVNQRANDTKINWVDCLGFSLFIFGFLFEVISDHQKSTFRSDPANKEKFMSTGLWSISRHPNYFGEIVLWLGIAISAFNGTGNYAVFISPVFVALLLIFVSGIPLLEAKADKVYGKIEEYQLYKKQTPVLVPFIGRRGSAMF